MSKRNKICICALLLCFFMSVCVSAQSREVFFYDEESAPEYTNPVNAAEADLGGRFSFATGVLYEFRLRTGPTWGASVTNSTAFAFYEWRGSYDTSLAGECVYSYTVRDHGDNDGFIIPMTEGLPPGEYLWVMTFLESDTYGVGLWLDSDCEGITSYISGKEAAGADFHASMVLDLTPVVTDPARVQGVTVSPYTEETDGSVTERISLLEHLTREGGFTLGVTETVLLILAALSLTAFFAIRITSTLRGGHKS